MKNTSIVLLILFAFSANAQEKAVGTDPSKIVGTTTPHVGVPVQCSGSANTQSLDLNWRPVLEKKVAEAEHPAPDQELIEKIKEQKRLLRMSNPGASHAGAEKTTAILPEIGPNFAGNTHNGMTPLDNSMAISNNGNIVSVSNHSIAYYDASGTSLYFRDIVTFMPSSFAVSAVCDPVVQYDVRADRFIFFCQEYTTTFSLFSNNRIFICFSKSNNPSDGWWCYAITGDPTVNGDAFDYPKLAVTDSELYISGNLFSQPANTFHQAVLFQMYKAAGYNGTTLSYLYYSNINGSPFTLLPVSYGQDGSYGSGVYCVSTHSGSGSSIDLFRVNANACCSPLLNRSTVSTTPYDVSGDAQQSGTSCLLNTGDCRALSGFWLNNTIHFVFNCDGGSGYTAINYNRLNTSSLSNTSTTMGLTGYDYAYPSVVSFATASTDKSVMIGFSRSGASIFPEIRVINCDNAMAWSASTLVKSSSTYISCVSSSARWGDYSGTSRRHNSSSPSIWMSSAFGDGSNIWDTWIAEVHAPGTGVHSVNEVGGAAKIYPNPVYENFNVEFSLKENADITIAVTDMNGRIVKELYKGKATSGDNSFSFNKSNLSNGIYFLNIVSGSKTVKNEKMVIAH
jgi:Secretion system C-terminal sorting domain